MAENQALGPIGIGDDADRQVGPECGFEAIENVLQLFVATVGNEFDDVILRARARSIGAVVPGPDGERLDHRRYADLLLSFGVEASWHAFDDTFLRGALTQNRVAVGVVSATELAPSFYAGATPPAPHAIVVTNYVLELDGTFYAYVGLDSNISGQETLWPEDHLAQGAAANGLISTPLLVTTTAVTVPETAPFYQRHADGSIHPAANDPEATPR